MTSAIIIILLVIIAVYFVFRKKGKITPAVINLEPTEYKKLLADHVAFYQKLDNTGKDRFE